MPLTGWLVKSRNVFLVVLEPEKSEIRAGLTQSVERATLDLEVMDLSSTLGGRVPFKKGVQDQGAEWLQSREGPLRGAQPIRDSYMVGG